MASVVYAAVVCVITLVTPAGGALQHRRLRRSSGGGTRQRQLPFDCYQGNGDGYVGLMARSASGRTCKNWRDEGSESMATKGMGNHNYCRNPSGGKERPWCFTLDPAKEWEYCEVPECPAEGAEPAPYVAPDGSKTEAPCVHEPPKDPGYTEWKAGRACADSKGTTWWLIGHEKVAASGVDGCKKHCSTVPGTEYFTVFGTPDENSHDCGCYRECILVEEDLTVNNPTAYRMK